MTDAAHDISEKALAHLISDIQVNDRFSFPVINSGKLRLFRFLFNDFYLLDVFGRNILCREFRVIQKERFSAYCYLIDLFPIDQDLAVVIDFNARKFFQQILKQVIICHQVCTGIVLNGIFLDDHIVPCRRYRSSFKGFF